MTRRFTCLLLSLSLLSVCCRAGAEDFAAGGYFSFKGAGLALDKRTSGHSMLSLTLNTDFSGVIDGRELYPGYRGALIFNQLFARGVTSSGVVVHGFAGPGVFYGYLRNHDGHFGHSAGLSGDLGVLADFPSGVRLSLGMTCDLGLSVRTGSRGIDNSVSKWYSNGIQRAWYPELKVMYRIGESRGASAASCRSGKVKWGLEWGFVMPFVYVRHFDYKVDEGYRVCDDGTYWHIHACGEVLGHVGYDVSPRLNLGVYAGYSGICAGYRVVPVSLRATYCLTGRSGGGAIGMVDYGIGLTNRKSVNIGKLGFGYRFAFDDGLLIDFMLVARVSGSYPDILDPDTHLPLPDSRIFRNNQLVGSLGLSMAVTL